MKARLQRKCGGGGCCAECDRKKLQREAIGPSPQRVPPIVHDVLRSSGEPLDRDTRAAMESRFAHDFSRVRLHRDERAAASAAAVGARGYTVGANVVLGRDAGRDTLAHELAHTIQQEGATYGGELEIGRADDPLEHDADGMARGRSPLALRREPPKKTKEPEKKEAPPEQHAGEPLTDEEAAKAGGAVTAAKLEIDEKIVEREKGTGPTETPRFILHDTSSKVDANGIKAKLDENRGPLGNGVNAYVPRDASATVIRPFFEAFRPTTTEFEKNLDVFKKSTDKATGGELLKLLKKRRDAQFRKVWALVDPVFYPHIFPVVLDPYGLTPKEIDDEVLGTNKNKKHQPGALEQLSDPKVDTIYTSATWGVEFVVNAVQDDSVANILAVSGKVDDLKAEAALLQDYFRGRNAIISSTITAEIVQPGVTKAADKAGFKNSCKANDARVIPFAKPSYSDTQYDSVRALYLRAAVMTRTLPFITTHKVVDEEYGGHCDPRCFNLGRLYNDIATTLGHNVGPSRYGVEPTYGNKAGKSIWWDNVSQANHVCAEAPPK